MMFVYEKDGNEITGTYKEFYTKFVDSRYFNPIVGGFVDNPRELIQSWLIDDLKLKFQNDKEHLYISDFIVCSL
jgi:hypothetical protein